MAEPDNYQRATFAAGCFWDAEAAFRRLDGVIETCTGYTGGDLPDPDYDAVSCGTTGHVEAVGIVFDPARVSYEELLDRFWEIHDPTQADGQGDYTGSQYRSAIFYHDEEQKTAALAARDRLASSGTCGPHPIITAILPAVRFWPAEACHQQFYEKCGRGYCMSRQVDE